MPQTRRLASVSHTWRAISASTHQPTWWPSRPAAAPWRAWRRPGWAGARPACSAPRWTRPPTSSCVPTAPAWTTAVEVRQLGMNHGGGGKSTWHEPRHEPRGGGKSTRHEPRNTTWTKTEVASLMAKRYHCSRDVDLYRSPLSYDPVSKVTRMDSLCTFIRYDICAIFNSSSHFVFFYSLLKLQMRFQMTQHAVSQLWSECPLDWWNFWHDSSVRSIFWLAA